MDLMLHAVATLRVVALEETAPEEVHHPMMSAEQMHKIVGEDWVLFRRKLKEVEEATNALHVSANRIEIALKFQIELER